MKRGRAEKSMGAFITEIVTSTQLSKDGKND